MVGACAHVLCHGVGREVHAGAPLDVEALACIGVVTHPELVEIGHQTIVDAPASACAALDDQVGILLADALQGAD